MTALLLSATVIGEVPVPLDFRSVPKLLNVPPPLNPALFRRSQTAPAWLLTTAPLVTEKMLRSVTVSKLLSVRPTRAAGVPEMVVGPRSLVTPVPLMMPEVQSVGPFTVIEAEPVRVLPL